MQKHPIWGIGRRSLWTTCLDHGPSFSCFCRSLSFNNHILKTAIGALCSIVFFQSRNNTLKLVMISKLLWILQIWLPLLTVGIPLAASTLRKICFIRCGTLYISSDSTWPPPNVMSTDGRLMAIFDHLHAQIRWGMTRNNFFQNQAAPKCFKYINLPFGGNRFFI